MFVYNFSLCSIYSSKTFPILSTCQFKYLQRLLSNPCQDFVPSHRRKFIIGSFKIESALEKGKSCARPPPKFIFETEFQSKKKRGKSWTSFAKKGEKKTSFLWTSFSIFFLFVCQAEDDIPYVWSFYFIIKWSWSWEIIASLSCIF